jgi:hypothetical protein
MSLAMSSFRGPISLSAKEQTHHHKASTAAQKPPMGWNSFDSYGVYLHEKAALENLEAFAEKLQPHGYEYFVVDNGWFGEYDLQPGTIFPNEKHAHDLRLNEFGHFLPSEVYFPNGFDAIVKRCKQLGVKFGVHLMRGIPRKAVELNLPIKGTKYTARDIANTSVQENCKWCFYCYGVNMKHPAAQAWYDGLVQHIVDLGVELIKYDDIVAHPDEVEAVAKAIRKTGKNVVLSLSPGRLADPSAIESFKTGHMLRVTPDVWDEQKYIDLCFAAWRKWQGKEESGFWIDMDMIPFGQLQLMSPPSDDPNKNPMSKGDVALAGKGVTRWCQLSPDQMRTFITMRAMAASPLMMGGDLPTLDALSHHLITTPEMLACNQNGMMGKLVSDNDNVETWTVANAHDPKSGWVAVFNRSDDHKVVNFDAKSLGLKPTVKSISNVWLGMIEVKDGLDRIGPNGVSFLKYQY